MLRISSSSKLSERKHSEWSSAATRESRLPKSGHVLFDFIQVVFRHAFRLVLLLTLHDVPFDELAYHRLVFDFTLVDLADDFLGTDRLCSAANNNNVSSYLDALPSISKVLLRTAEHATIDVQETVADRLRTRHDVERRR
jgi:hypothetical protein